MTKRRLRFKCWSCEREYSLTRELSGEQTLLAACPYCNKEAVVDLAPFRKKVKTVVRTVGATEQDIGEALDLPEVLPTREPE